MIRLLSAFLGFIISASVGAVTWDTSTPGIGLTTGSIYCDTNGTGANCATSAGSLGGSIVQLTAYSTPTLQASGLISPTDTGNWVNAQIAIYSGGGIGISNDQQHMATTNGVLSEGTSSPQHAIDNRGVDDILVVDFQSNNWDVSSFSLGYTCTINTATSTASNSDPSPNCSGSTVDIQAWVGGTSTINFNNVSFVGGVPTIAGQTFQELTFPTSGNPGGDPGGAGVRTDTSSFVGRYLVITGSLAGSTDAFKVSSISAAIPNTPSGQTPVPGSAPLVVLGLLALTWAYRRRPAVVR